MKTSDGSDNVVDPNLATIHDQFFGAGGKSGEDEGKQQRQRQQQPKDESGRQDTTISNVDKYLDSLLAQEFTRLTFEEREKSYEELHGVSDLVDETPAFVANCLQRMDMELLGSRVLDKGAYLLAKMQNAIYVTDPKFRLCFLRAESFDPQKASRRFVAFFEGKLKLFGAALLTQRIRFDDLDKDDQACLTKGQLQVLPTRDRAGRAVLCDMNMIDEEDFKVPMNRLKAFAYIMMTLAEDEENQKRGIVGIFMQLGYVNPAKMNRELSKGHPEIMKWIPIRMRGSHFCMDDAILSTLAKILLLGSQPDFRARHRIHIGTYTELLYSLMTYGIPVDNFPMNEDSMIKTTNHKRWISRRKTREYIMTLRGGFFATDLPRRHDVLLGKGKPTQENPGNVQLRAFVDDHMEEYNATEKGMKGLVITKVLASVKATSGRFLEKDKAGWWHEISDADAKDKITKSFLSVGTKLNKAHHQQHAAVLLRGATDEDNEILRNSSIFQPEKRQKLDPSSCCCKQDGL